MSLECGKTRTDHLTTGLQSIRIFIRVQWEPFEADFGTIKSDLDRHVSVLEKAAVAKILDQAEGMAFVWIVVV